MNSGNSISENNNRTALVVTVGGSHRPVMSAIESVKPDFILFVCSTDDSVTGSKGSYEQVERKGNFIKARYTDEKPTLPNIRIQAGYEGEYKCIQTNPDDLDGLYTAISLELEVLTREYARVVCDYTGGTKSMSAALVLTATDNPRAELNLISGPRGNLQRVQDTHGKARVATTGKIRFQREFNRAVSLWQSHSYSVSADLLNNIVVSDSDNQGERDFALECSKGFAAWDVFDHATAKDTLSFIRGRLKALAGVYITPLEILCKPDIKGDAARILDLWRNAERCVVRGRYDDATARAYRLLEWCAQWLLKHYCDVASTAAVPAELVPGTLTLRSSQTLEGAYQASLMQSWELVAANCGPECEKFWGDQRETVRDLLMFRNNSLLAHGDRPVSAAEWKRMADFIDRILLPHMLVHFEAVKINKLPDQLPVRWLE